MSMFSIRSSTPAPAFAAAFFLLRLTIAANPPTLPMKALVRFVRWLLFLAFFLFAGIMALLVRIELFSPGRTIMDPDTYNRVFTIHGVVMVFFFLIPSTPAVLGNFLIPPMLGAKDLDPPFVAMMANGASVTNVRPK